ncbi:MAG: ATP-binding protein [candidate division NC10 bacterium]|nr:ATP-binding protein [candidate division NC10 bacterium]
MAPEFFLPGDLWPAEIDEGQISQVIHNLVLNACQAMPGGGKIQIRAQNLVLEEPCPIPLAPGKYIQVSLIDQGIGIPRQYLSRIFDPFFTTKQKGSGLGLATAYSILKNHGGYLTAESELGKGSTFALYLPASSQEVEAPKAEQAIPIPGKGKILIMDDEESVRASAREVLIYLGYEATLAEDGGKAIQLYQEARDSGEPFAAVILDLTVPAGIGGEKAMGRLLEIDPQVKAIVSSGYSEDPIMANFRTYGFSGVLSKPYRIEEMSQVLQEVIHWLQPSDGTGDP